jgi:hypothetical protein
MIAVKTLSKKAQRQHIQAWIEALESGKYRQTTNFLCKKDESSRYKHCCLGVLCEVEGIVPTISKEGYKRYHGKEDMLPRTVFEQFGQDGNWVIDMEPIFGKIKTSNTKLFNKICKVPSDRRSEMTLTMLNDDYNLTFKEIATVLRLVYNIK